MSTTPPLHDLVIRTIAEYLIDDNKTVVKLQRLNGRFYGLRDIFIKALRLSTTASNYACENKPYGWNKVYSMYILYWNQSIDLSFLTGCRLQSMRLSCCRTISDVSALRNLRFLTIYICPCISDVSALGSLHYLRIATCVDIIDVSALGSVHTLILEGCHSIRDVSALWSVRNLTIQYCLGITDVSALKMVPKLIINECPNIVKN